NLEESYKRILNVGCCKVPYEDLSDIIGPNPMVFGTTKDEKILSFEGIDALFKSQFEQKGDMESVLDRKRIAMRISKDGNNAFIVEEITLILSSPEAVHTIFMRATCVMEYLDNQWKLTHWHTSSPVDTENDPWHLEEWKREKEKLQQLVDQQTVDLKRNNRELEIEVALERVRSTAMAMQKSGDLKKVVGDLYEQLRTLGFQWGVASITIMDPNTGDMDWWMEGVGDGYLLPERYHVPFFDHLGHLQQLEQWKNGTPYAEIEISGQEKKSYDAYYFFQTDFVHAPGPSKQLMMQQESVRFSMAFMKYGALSWSPTPLSNDQATILERFAKVFEQCYTRFLDLQKAEAQTREAKIEAALERTRVKAMSIQRSNELKEIVKVVFDSLLELDFIIRDGAVSILVFEKGSKDHIQWIADPDHVFPEFRVEFSDHTLLTDIISGWENGSIGYQKIYPYKEKREYFEFLFEHNPSFNATPLEIKNLLLESREYGYSIAFGRHSALSVATNIGKLLTPNEFEILKRFSNVFDQAYTRFLDIKKAEVQAREAQIQLALERVRARTMAMHNSSELIETAELLFGQLKQLGAESQGVAFAICEKENIMVQKWTSIGVFSVPYTLEAGEQRMYEAWKNQSEIYEEVYEGERIRKYYELFMEIPEFKQGIQQLIDSGTPLPDWQKNHAVPFKYGYLLFITTKPFVETHIFSRFAKVFDQTYTRFLDLQKAEAQAREAQIEAALEKIRSRSLEMQSSSELKDVIATMIEKLEELKVIHGTLAIQLFDFETMDSIFWPGTHLQDETRKVQLPFDQKMMEEDTCHRDLWIAKEKGKTIFNKVYTRQQKDRWFEYVFAHNDSTVIEERAREYIRVGEIHTVCFFPEKNAALFADSWDGSKYSEDEFLVLKRVAKVFDQAYTRFLDLEKAEVQAREAQIEAALEKVRSTSLAIHQSHELEKVVVVLFDKLKELGVPFDSAFIYLFDKPKKNIVAWVASILLETPIIVNMPYDDEIQDNPIIADLWHAIESGEHGLNKVYKEKDKDVYYRYEAKHNKSIIPESITDFQLQSESWITSFATEKNSIVGFDSWQGHLTTHEDFQLLKRSAKVFEQAYIRFLDLQKAEAQAREAQIEAALEKVRSTSLAMHRSDEMEKVIMAVSERLTELGFQFDGTLIFIFDSEKRNIILWIATNQLAVPLKVELPYDLEVVDNAVWNALWNAIDKGEHVINKTFSGKIKDDYFRYVQKYNAEIIPSPVQKLELELPNWSISMAAEKNAILAVDSWSGKDITHDEFQILVRFSKVFEQAYVRFLDLQKAEAQAREAQIEVALERVRSRTMAMQRSNELTDVAMLLFQQVKELGIKAWTTGFNVWQANNTAYIDYVTDPSGDFLEPTW
uniref:nuclear transport factor 2 family protein n=1 Tax=Aquiflexum sp. TaxID=1872584 RepID=UPI003592F89F